MPKEKILLVDDEERLLSGLKRQLRSHYDVAIASSGAAALELVPKDGPFAVIISDMRMPEMTGLELLAKMKEATPETVRMMLTGNADQGTAVDAINAGNIFRFFSKPCEISTLIDGIEAGVAQYKLVMAEKNLIEQTLAGSLKLLSDMMSLIDPAIVQATAGMRTCATLLAQEMKMTRAWELDFACMLAPVGMVALPRDLYGKVASDGALSQEERAVVARCPEIGRNLIANIPRMAAVAEAVLYQDKNFDGTGFPDNDVSGNNIPLKGRALHVLKAIYELVEDDTSLETVFSFLESKPNLYDPSIVAHAKTCLTADEEAPDDPVEKVIEERNISQLHAGQELLTDITATDGRLLLKEKSVLTQVQVERLRSLAKVMEINEPVRVMTYPKSGKNADPEE